MAETCKDHARVCKRTHGLSTDNPANALDMRRYWNIDLGSPVLADQKLWFEVNNPRRKIIFQKLLRKC